MHGLPQAGVVDTDHHGYSAISVLKFRINEFYNEIHIAIKLLHRYLLIAEKEYLRWFKTN